MATHAATRSNVTRHDSTRATHRTELLRYAVPLGRFLLALIFLKSAPGHFAPRAIEFAASQGVPFAYVTVPVSGALALLGGLSVAIGYKTRVGALLLALFLIPVTLAMHRFWEVSEPQMAMLQEIMFLKNLSMLGGIILIAYFGAGPISFDEGAGRPAAVG